MTASRFVVSATPLSGVMRIQRQRRGDERGFLTRMFCGQELAYAGWTWPIAQITHTQTENVGTLRGMHWQCAPMVEAKLVNCLRGAVWDVVVDLRCGSPTFLKWHAECLSAAKQVALLIPPGFAHGFQALEQGSELVYLHSVPHSPEHEAGADALDPRLSIAWPLPVRERSGRDASHPPLGADFEGIAL